MFSFSRFANWCKSTLDAQSFSNSQYTIIAVTKKKKKGLTQLDFLSITILSKNNFTGF